ncbi:MAG TPA: glycerophosphodiester phosphodiesterase family protein [Microvirga sp.]|jgi:glycerophosphoryl diester phosphodiesterase|nr:glycerophosphodiester phosphodiesterase family protein [Microvirga sp.]
MTDLSWIVAKPIAHRGLHDRAAGVIENTLTAADAAIAGGFGIECDVQLTRDGEAVVFHDFTLDRLTAEKGEVVQRSADELARTAIAGSAGDRIPTLQAFLDRIDGRVPLVVEIKSRFDGNTALTRRTCEILAGYSGPFVIKSFDPDVLATVREIAPGVTRGIVGEGDYSYSAYDSLSAGQKHALANLLHYDRSGFQFVSWKIADLPSAGPYLARTLGRMPLMAWTVRTPEERARAAAHADQMVFEGFVP